MSRWIGRFRTTDGDESGQALVEFALVLPLLLLIIFGIIDFGKAFNYWVDETHIANQAARIVEVNGTTGGGSFSSYLYSLDGMPSELKNGGTASIPTRPTVCVSYPNGTSNVGDPVQVMVSTSYHWLPFLSGGLFGFGSPSVSLTGSATMRLEQTPTNFPAGCS